MARTWGMAAVLGALLVIALTLIAGRQAPQRALAGVADKQMLFAATRASPSQQVGSEAVLPADVLFQAKGKPGPGEAPVTEISPMSSEESYAMASEVQAAFRQEGMAACRSAAHLLERLIVLTPDTDLLWAWAMDRVDNCLLAPPAQRLAKSVLDHLAALKPEHPRIMRQLGFSAYQLGDVREAIHQLQPASTALSDFRTLQTLADSRLLLAGELARSGDSAGSAEQARLAEGAVQRALESAPLFWRPYGLHTMARVQLELGHASEAIRYADAAVEALGSVPGATRQANQISEMHLFVGQVYFRAGQQDVGMAYMEQGIAMAASVQQRQHLAALRDQFLADYPGRG